MKRTGFLKFALVVLLLLNIGTLVFFLCHKPPHHHGPIDSFLIKEIGFNEKQAGEFKKLKEQHHSQMMAIHEKEKPLHDAFDNLLKSDSPDFAKADSIADLLSKEMSEVHKITFRHFADVRKLCDENQKKNFDRVIGEIMKRMGPKPPPPPPGERP